jgi:hypothetical protein
VFSLLVFLDGVSLFVSGKPMWPYYREKKAGEQGAVRGVLSELRGLGFIFAKYRESDCSVGG